MPQLPGGRRGEHLAGSAHGLESLAVGLLGGVEQRGLGLDVGLRREGADDVGAAHAVEHGEHGVEVEAEPLAEAAPLALDDGARVDERTVEIEEQRRHTRMRAALRATPYTASSTSPRSSPSACSGIACEQATCISSTSCR